MKHHAFTLFTITCSFGLLVWFASGIQPNRHAAQAHCTEGDAARACWHKLEHRPY